MSDKKQGANKPMGGGPHGPIIAGEKAKNFKGSVSKLVKYLNRYHGAIIFVFIAAALSSLFTILGPKILSYATNELFAGSIAIAEGTGGINFAMIAEILLFLGGLYLLATGLSYLQSFIMTGITQKVTFSLREDINKKISRLPLSYFDKTSTGDVLSRVTNDIDTVNQSLNQSLTHMITSITAVVGVVIMMLTISPTMTLVALLTLPLSFGLVAIIVKKSQPQFKKQQATLGKVNGHIEEMYSGHIVVQAFDRSDESIKKFNDINEELYSSAWKSQFLSWIIMPLIGFVGNLGYAAICMLGGLLTIQGKISVGDIQAFIQYVRSFNQPITQIANISNVLQQTAAAAERVFEFLEEDEEEKDPEDGVDPAIIKGEVSFAHVKFGYKEDETIINDFSAIIEPGQRVAIVGPTGAGKTTIIKLLMRFYELNDGAILLDKYSLTQFKRNDLRDLFGMVHQDTWLYSGTIMENIRYGRLEATDEEVIKAAKAAGVHHFIKTLPNGYESVLSEDASNVSGGQKQLLTIARAILSDPKVLILDEATSSVDTRTEQKIQKAMNDMMKGRTSFVIAHRLSTIRDSDVIMVMREGDIVEMGNHDKLIEIGGFYKTLYESQFEETED